MERKRQPVPVGFADPDFSEAGPKDRSTGRPVSRKVKARMPAMPESRIAKRKIRAERPHRTDSGLDTAQLVSTRLRRAGRPGNKKSRRA